MKLPLLCLIAVAYCTALPEEPPAAYYWTDYRGVVPNNAVLAGLTKDKQKVFIGQALVYNKGVYGNIPGSFVKFPLEVVLGGVVKVDDYATILCSNAHNNLKWVRTDTTTYFTDIAGTKLISGGVQKHIDGKKPEENLAIGRTVHAQEHVVGKVYALNQTHVALDYAYDGHRFTAVHFEVLVHV